MKIIRKVLIVLGFTVYATSASAIPVDYIITVDGRDWAQPSWFRGLSWNQIDAACPTGICEGGVLGFEVGGWIWASPDEVNTLFNSYLSAAGVSGNDLLGPGPDRYWSDEHTTWAPAFFADGWRESGPITNFISETSGLTSQLSANPDYAYAASIGDYWNFNLTGDFARSDVQVDLNDGNNGAWFYRAPGVPVPATLGLFCLAFAGLGWVRHRNV